MNYPQVPDLLALEARLVRHLPDLPDLPVVVLVLVRPQHAPHGLHGRVLFGQPVVLLEDVDLCLVLGGGQRQAGLLVQIVLLPDSAERLDELHFVPVLGLLLLEDVVEVVVPLLVLGLGGVDGVHDHFGVVHGAPADQAAVVVEGLELVLLDVPVDGFLDVELLLHLLLKLIDRILIKLVRKRNE